MFKQKLSLAQSDGKIELRTQIIVGLFALVLVGGGLFYWQTFKERKGGGRS